MSHSQRLAWWRDCLVFGAWRDGVIGSFFRRDSWNSKITGVMTWKWCMAWWRHRPVFLGMNCEFILCFTWCKKGEKVKKMIINTYSCTAICLKVSFQEAKIISYCPYIATDRPLYNFKFSIIIAKISYSSRSKINISK